MKKALILGGSRGIGYSISKNLENCEIVSLSSRQCNTSNLKDIQKTVIENPEVDVLVLNTGGGKFLIEILSFFAR